MIILLPLLLLLNFVHALPLNSVSFFSAPTSLLTLPASPQLTVSVALCTSQASSARFFFTNNVSADVFELQLDDGQAAWSGSAPAGGFLSVQDLDQGSFQISLSDNGTTHDVLDQLPLLGDTTSNQAILFSHPFLPFPIEQPSYPNYTLLPANLSIPADPSFVPNLTLVIAPTSAQLSSLPQTACALLNSSSLTGSVVGNEPWLRSSHGWRSQWLVDDLSPSTNYTAYVIQDTLKVSGPIYFTTKSGRSFSIPCPSLTHTTHPASFPCPLVYSLPYCPSIAYAVPLPPPPAPAFGYDVTSLPDTISSPLLQYMANFTAMLSTFPCGRDLYSPLQTCADCQTHYRNWLCSVSFPRCSEPAPGEDYPNAASTSFGTTAMAQVPPSALSPQPSGSPSRNPYFPNAGYDYSSLLPCLETCNAVDRACPYFLGIKCPTTKFNAATSYGVGFIDSGKTGEKGNGVTGTAQDRWGNVWCNGN